VVVAPRDALATNALAARGRVHIPVAHADAKLRYRSHAVPARVTTTRRGFKLDLEQPAYAVARGQTAVLYEDDVVVGAGVITSTTT
jgi:tRNA-specific 2-thiouridylase